MARKMYAKIVTANDLLEGDNVYFTSKNTWSDKLGDAVVAMTIVQAEDYLATADVQSDKIVGAYLADVRVGEDGRPEPVHFREQFRALGPSNYFHGKQSQA